MSTCFVCNGTRHHENRDLMHEIVIEDRIICFGLTCLNEILIQYVKDWEARDAAMTERMNRHEAELKKEESITTNVCIWVECILEPIPNTLLCKKHTR